MGTMISRILYDLEDKLEALTQSQELPILEIHAIEFTLKQLYKTHNEYVKSAVRKEDLLVWNVKDGWEPLCVFLGKEVPSHPVPHDNKGGDMKWNENYASACKIFLTYIQFEATNFQ